MSVDDCWGTNDIDLVVSRVARKDHTCSACVETIPRGTRYHVHKLLFDGCFSLSKRCWRCQRIFVHLCDVTAFNEGAGVDIDLMCGHTYQEVFQKDPPPEIAALAFASASKPGVV